MSQGCHYLFSVFLERKEKCSCNTELHGMFGGSAVVARRGTADAGVACFEDGRRMRKEVCLGADGGRRQWLQDGAGGECVF